MQTVLLCIRFYYTARFQLGEVLKGLFFHQDYVSRKKGKKIKLKYEQTFQEILMNT